MLIKAVFYLLGLFLIAVALWTEKFFGHVTVVQALSTINFGIEGALTSDPSFMERFLKWCIIWPTIICVLLLLLESRRPFARFFSRCKLAFVIPVIGICFVCYQFSVPQFIISLSKPKSDYFKANYLDPTQVSISLHHPKSLVLIYVEGLENTYSDTHLFGHDLLKNLNKLKANGITFNHYLTMPGTNWTAAGITATQCGVPFKSLTILGNNRQGEIMNSFLGHATCLSDILAKFNYRNVYLNGSSLKSCGVGNFFNTHHYHEIYGRDEWLAKGYRETEMSGWGLHDDDLFAQAKIKLAELINSKQLFNLTILTIDTHGFYGTPGATCKKATYQGFEGTVECAADQVADFVSYIQKQGWLKKVNVVVLGDHVAMHNVSYDKLATNQNRIIFNMFITEKPLKKNTDEIVGFDVYPTILESLGFSIPGDKLGLGYSAISTSRMTPDNRISEMQQNIDAYSETYNKLW